jgi:hypothetical protein
MADMDDLLNGIEHSFENLILSPRQTTLPQVGRTAARGIPLILGGTEAHRNDKRPKTLFFSQAAGDADLVFVVMPA